MFDAGASSGVRAILCHPKKICLLIVYVSCVLIFGYPFGSNKGSDSHSSIISVLGRVFKHFGTHENALKRGLGN